MYTVLLSGPARRDLRRLDTSIQQRIMRVIESLAETPRPTGCKRLKGSPYWRIRVGDFRILYTLDEKNVLVIRVRHRREVYRQI